MIAEYFTSIKYEYLVTRLEKISVVWQYVMQSTYKPHKGNMLLCNETL